jgi:hypothetical protein
MKVVLTRKLADCIDGIDVSGRRTGDVLDLPAAKARLLMAEEWAIPDRRHSHDPPPERDRRGSEIGHGRGEDDFQRAS